MVYNMGIVLNIVTNNAKNVYLYSTQGIVSHLFKKFNYISYNMLYRNVEYIQPHGGRL